MSSKSKEETIVPISVPPYSEEYGKVMENAFARGAADKSNMVRVKHLIAALCELCPNEVKKVLGKDMLAIPKTSAVSAHTQKPPPTFSSEVNRILSVHGGVMEEVVKPLGKPVTIDALHLAAAVFLHPTGPALEFLNMNALSSSDKNYESRIRQVIELHDDDVQRRNAQERLPRQLAALRKLRAKMVQTCFGQDQAIRAVMAAICSFWGDTTHGRHGLPLSFAFIGGTGTGKTVLAKVVQEQLARAYGEMPVAAIDMTRFSCQSLSQDLIGRDSAWRDGGQEGVLTSLAARNPYAVILIENFDKAHPDALAYLNTLLCEGTLKDAYTNEDVSFARCIVIFTTNQGSEFVASERFFRLSEANGGTIPRERLVDGIVAAIDDARPDVIGAVADIVRKVDHAVIFHNHTVDSLLKIIDRAVDGAIDHTAKLFSATVTADRSALRNFFVEPLQKLDSAHGLEQSVKACLCTEMQNAIMDSDSFDPNACSRISISVDPLPPLEAGVVPPTDIADRTAMRLKQAKRLDYQVKVESAADFTRIHITGLHYTVLPSIEDAGWFAVVPSDVKTTDFVGLERPWQSVKRTIDYFKSPSSDLLKPETGILLYGPPGTGKTSFAKAVASELGKSFICVNGSEFSATTNDNRAIRRIHSLFSVARRNDAVLFIDEIDAIGNRSDVPAAQAAVINALLTELDGFEERRILVIGATNRLDMLDIALLRPGRLHTRIKVDVLRKASDRETLVKILCSKAKRTLAPELQEFIVRTTDGWAPANIQSVINETFHRAGTNEATRNDFIDARNVEFSGEETQRCELTEEERRAVSVHEAGHALVSTIYGHKWLQVTVNGTGGNLGFLERLSEGALGWSEKKLSESIDVVLAGRAAESLLATPSEGSESDFRKATDYATRLVRGGFGDTDELAITPDSAMGAREWERIRPKVNAILAERRAHVSKMLDERRALLERVAQELFSKSVLFVEDVEAIIAAAPIVPSKEGAAK